MFSRRSPDEIDRLAWLRPAAPWGQVRLSLLISLTVLTAAAWALTLYQALGMHTPTDMAAMDMTAMDMSGGTMPSAGWPLAGAAVFLAMWTVMMAAMMLPAALPMILIFASAQTRRKRDAAVPTWIFIAGYILVWMVAGLLAYFFVAIGGAAADRFTTAGGTRWTSLAFGATLIAAGLYQFTPVKRVCLSHCRSPVAFVAQHWRDGRIGALGMGVRHGAYCLGCCWALFAVLIAAGVMSIAWMLLITLVVFVEKVVPQGRRIAAATGVVLVALGLLIAGGVVAMPWRA
jgi:predicted metal-binding membrane protein